MKEKMQKTVQVIRNVGMVFIIYFLNAQVAYAANGTEKIDQIATEFLRPWLIRIGMVLSLFGAVSLVISVTQDNPQAKTVGIQFISGGLMLAFGIPFFMRLIGF